MDIKSMTIEKASQMLYKKDISVWELTKEYLKRIEEKDSSIGAYTLVCREKAKNDSEKAQKMIDDNKATLLTGIPMALKDNICTKGIKTTCASRMLENFTPVYNATAAELLEEAGCVLLGKTNLDEFAMGSSTENSSLKITRNPIDVEKVPGGSSGGSAAAVGASLAVFALGSDTGGSIRQPAAFCGVTGIKPTYGSVSRYGLVAFASSLDQIGPLTRCVKDSAYVLNAICKKDIMDSTSTDRGNMDYTEGIDEGIKGMKIAIPRQYFEKGLSEDVKEAVLSSIKKYEALGAYCEEIDLKLHEYAISAYYIISSAEASSNLARYDGIKYGIRAKEFDNLSELYENTRSSGFGEEVKRRIMLGTYVLSSGYYDAYYKKALKARTLIKREFDEIFEKYDVIVGPTAPTTAYKIGEKISDPLEMYLGDVYTVGVNIAGLPAISIPCRRDLDSLPAGLQIIGKAYGEKTILKCGYALENA